MNRPPGLASHTCSSDGADGSSVEVGEFAATLACILNASSYWLIACRDFRVGDDLVASTVEGLHGIDDLALVTSRDSGRILHVEHRIAGRMKMNALKLPRQESAVPLARRDRLVLPTAGRRHHDEARKVGAFAAESVEQPRAHCRPAADRRARVHEGVCGVVVDRLCLHRAQDADVVGD